MKRCTNLFNRNVSDKNKQFFVTGTNLDYPDNL
jgi:hypothetical protein